MMLSMTSISFPQSFSINKTQSIKNEKVNYNPILRFGKDLLIQFSAPFSSKENVYWLGAGVIATSALISTDQATYNTIKDVQYDFPFISNISPVISEFGSNYGLGLLGVYSGYSLIFKNKKAIETSYLATEAFVTSSIWVVAIKWLTGRERPSAKNNFSKNPGGEWEGPFAFFRRESGQSISSFDAFPSGHTATVFSIATVFANQYSSNLIIPILAYGVASLVGISRIIENTHWASDVFVGALIGYLSAKEILVNNPSELSRRNKTEKLNKNYKDNKKTSIGFDFGYSTLNVWFKF